MKLMQQSESEKGSSNPAQAQINLANSPFIYKKQIYYIPVYPRAFLQQIINIDEQRRTITAKFVVYITICIKVDNTKLKKYLADHLILQFGYNQIIFIPEDITLQNSPFLITKMPMKDGDDYATYRIKGKIQCNAEFDSMFFPYRRIQISNHLCINSQQFREYDQTGSYMQYTIKYNFVTLSKIQHSKQSQFVSQFNDICFGSFKIDNASFEVATDTDPQLLKKRQIINTSYYLGKIAQITKRKKQLKQSKKQQQQIQRQKNQLKLQQEYLKRKNERLLDFEPYKHIVFRFQMSSIHLAFVLQQEVPIFVLSIVTLFLFHAQPNIGNKYSCIILLLVSYISIISNFRLNHIAQQTLTFYQFKLMVLTLVPILLIITTRIDFYNMNLYEGRTNQIDNPFAYLSLIIVILCFGITLAFLVYVWAKKFIYLGRNQIAKENMMDWGNMKELDWSNHQLQQKITHILYRNKDRNLLVFFDETAMESIRRKSQPSMDETTNQHLKTINVKAS